MNCGIFVILLAYTQLEFIWSVVMIDQLDEIKRLVLCGVSFNMIRWFTPQQVSFALPPSIFSPYLVSTPLSHLVVFRMLAPLFGIPFHLILNLLTRTLPSNPISKLTFSLLKAFLVPNNFISALLIRHFYVDFSVENIYYYYYYYYYYCWQSFKVW